MVISLYKKSLRLISNQTTKLFLVLILSSAFAFISFFGVHLTMQEDVNGRMKNCPLLGQAETICTMSASEHIEAWQNLFTAAFQSNKFLLSSLLLLGFAVMVFIYKFNFSLLSTPSSQVVKKRDSPFVDSPNFLLRALSSGILRKRE